MRSMWDKKYINNFFVFSYLEYIYKACLTILNIVSPWYYILKFHAQSHDWYLDYRLKDDNIAW